jgi:hypothetical protein
MKSETVKVLLSVLTQLATHSQENRIKLTALQRAIQDEEPAAWVAYQEWDRKLRSDPTVRLDHKETRKVLDSLHEALLLDQ